MKRTDITKEVFIDEFNNSKSIKELKEKLNCSYWTILDRMKKYNLSKRHHNKEIFLSNKQNEIIIGSLLGDGSIFRNIRCTTAYFSYVSSEKEHVEYIYNFLKEFMTIKYKNGPVKYKRYDDRTNKIYISYSIRTENNISFLKIMNEWYKNKKIIPENVELTPLICKVWYLGDGCLLKNKRGGSQGIKLSTDGFDPIYVMDVIKKLSNFDAKIQYRNKEKTQSAIIIPRIKIKEFLNYIEECPVKCYEYKWNYIPCKSEKVEENGVSNIKIYENEIINKYLNGDSASALSKCYKCDSALIKYYLKKNNIEIKSERHKYKISYHNGEVLIIDNMLKFCKENSIYPTQIYRHINSNTKCKNFTISKFTSFV